MSKNCKNWTSVKDFFPMDGERLYVRLSEMLHDAQKGDYQEEADDIKNMIVLVRLYNEGGLLFGPLFESRVTNPFRGLGANPRRGVPAGGAKALEGHEEDKDDTDASNRD